MKVSIVWFTAMSLTMVFVLLTQTIKKTSRVEKETWTQFECGFNAMNPALLPFSFQFFMISLLFLIFDVEIALIISYPLEPLSMKKLIMMTMFMTILSIGLMYEWQKSKICWSK